MIGIKRSKTEFQEIDSCTLASQCCQISRSEMQLSAQTRQNLLARKYRILSACLLKVTNITATNTENKIAEYKIRSIVGVAVNQLEMLKWRYNPHGFNPRSYPITTFIYFYHKFLQQLTQYVSLRYKKGTEENYFRTYFGKQATDTPVQIRHIDNQCKQS